MRRATPNFGGYIRSHKSFLSTLSLRRATCNFTQKRHPPHNFYPRSPCGERLVHALKFSNLMLFLSTLSLRRATNTIRKRQIIPIISIHALLAESDLWVLRKVPILGIFLSTLSLRRATSHLSKFNTSQRVFLSTLSLRRATFLLRKITITVDISIHALLAESDSSTQCRL